MEEQGGERPSGGGRKSGRNCYNGLFRGVGASGNEDIGADTGTAARYYNQFQPDSSDCTRFRYCPKAPQSQRYFYCHDCDEVFPIRERKEHGHAHVNDKGRQAWKHITYFPTQKPLDLMKWLCRLVTPPDGVVLDPFAGSGTTLVAAYVEGFSAVGIEQDEIYCKIAQKRIEVEASMRQLQLEPQP